MYIHVHVHVYNSYNYVTVSVVKVILKQPKPHKYMYIVDVMKKLCHLYSFDMYKYFNYDFVNVHVDDVIKSWCIIKAFHTHA